MMRDEHKPVYAASSSTLTTDFDAVDSDDNYAGSDRHERGGCGSALTMPGYQQMMRGAPMESWVGSNGAGSSSAKDENHVSFAKCLLLMYEKAINVQF